MHLTERKRIGIVLLGLLALAAPVSVAAAQSDDHPEATTRQAERAARQREYIERRIQQIRREQDRLESLLEQLNEGSEIQVPMGFGRGRDARPPGEMPARDLFEPGPPGGLRHDQPRHDPRRCPSWADLSDEQRGALHDLAKHFSPHLTQQLDDLREENPQRYERVLDRNMPRLLEMMELRSRDQEMFDLKLRDSKLAYRSMQLARAFQLAEQADDDARLEELEDQLTAVLSEHFDVRQKIREHELEMIAVRVRDLEEELTDRAQHREELIGERREALLEAIRRAPRHRPGPPPDEHADQPGDADSP
ncbi:MAG: hypothetical protein KAS72_10840 [Phycisphaerales bacterium]|nr:hypothetical protein [Phycisphaerales bacterium]